MVRAAFALLLVIAPRPEPPPVTTEWGLWTWEQVVAGEAAWWEVRGWSVQSVELANDPDDPGKPQLYRVFLKRTCGKP